MVDVLFRNMRIEHKSIIVKNIVLINGTNEE